MHTNHVSTYRAVLSSQFIFLSTCKRHQNENNTWNEVCWAAGKHLKHKGALSPEVSKILWITYDREILGNSVYLEQIAAKHVEWKSELDSLILTHRFLKGHWTYIFQYYFWLNFIYHVRIDRWFTNTKQNKNKTKQKKKKKRKKFLLKVKILPFLLSILKTWECD